MTGRGGARKGAGRPPKWAAEDVIRIGSACEERMRQAQTKAVADRLSALPNAETISEKHSEVSNIPVDKRAHWLRSHAYQDHRGDIEAFLHAQAGTPFDEGKGRFIHRAPRVVTVSRKPPRGARKQIIADVAASCDLTPIQVANLWQEFRRLFSEGKD